MACAIPALRLLQSLDLYGFGEDQMATIGRSLKALPLPLLDWLFYTIGFRSCWEALRLPPTASRWDNTAILQHWHVQQHKVATFASGLHVRLGAASRVFSLNDVALMLIADDVLGGLSLVKLWQRERLEREGEPASSLA